jgi:adenylate kinase
MTNGVNNFVIVGPQGSGKGTQADLLAKKLSIPHISTGDIFREMRTEDTPLGKQVRELIDNGKLVPDEITNKIVAERLSRKDALAGFILDGYPRNTSQSETLDRAKKISKCILIDVSDEESIKRIGARRICPSCKANFNTIYIKPKKEGVCDKCGAKLIIRDDDKPESVKFRLKKYHDETEPVLKFYEKKGVLLKIDGEQPIDKVFKDLEKALSIK